MASLVEISKGFALPKFGFAVPKFGAVTQSANDFVSGAQKGLKGRKVVSTGMSPKPAAALAGNKAGMFGRKYRTPLIAAGVGGAAGVAGSQFGKSESLVDVAKGFGSFKALKAGRSVKAPAFAANDPFAAASMPGSLAKPAKRRVRPMSGRSPQTALTEMDRVRQSAEMGRQASLRRAGGKINKPANPFDMVKSEDGVEKGLPSVTRGGLAGVSSKDAQKYLSNRMRGEAWAMGHSRKPEATDRLSQLWGSEAHSARRLSASRKKALKKPRPGKLGTSQNVLP